MQVYRLRGALALTAIVAAAACSDNLSAAKLSSFYSNLSWDQEVPLPTFAAGFDTTKVKGTATLTLIGPATTNAPGDSINYSVTYGGLTGNPTVSHIHVGAGTAAGLVRVNLCGTGVPAPACPAATSGTISGHATVIVGGISFDSLYSAMKTGGAYVNIHTTANPGGEMRGVINKPACISTGSSTDLCPNQ
jgi:hypothetical protein